MTRRGSGRRGHPVRRNAGWLLLAVVEVLVGAWLGDTYGWGPVVLAVVLAVVFAAFHRSRQHTRRSSGRGRGRSRRY